MQDTGPKLDDVPPDTTIMAMTARAQKIVADALRLDRDARATLTKKLILSLDEAPKDKNAEGAWLKEVSRRRKEIAAGRDVLISHADVMREAWAQLHAARRHAS